MDLLSGTPSRPKTAWWRKPTLIGAGLAVLTVTACLVVQAPSGPHFSHEVHAVASGLDCVLCHAGARSADEAGMPALAVCARCHGEADQGPIGPDHPLGPRFFDGGGRLVGTRFADVSEEVRFSHVAHVGEYGLDCSDCHGDAGTSDFVPAESAVTKRDCMSCHAERGRRDQCSDCHSVVDRDWAPDTHRHLWSETHGQVVRFGPETSANRCDLCHDRATSCNSCHARSVPKDHTNFWRLRAHGFAVSLDRSRCSACHKRDSCTRCHERTEPLSHSAGWGAPMQRHCTGCHFPLASNGCVTCHKSTPSHQLATPMPSWHVPSMNCRGCHGMGVPLPHADGGQVCTACHR